MKVLKTTLKFITIIILLIIVLFFIYWINEKPKYKGKLKLKGLTEKVEVYFDNIGVPHIYANNQEDAYITLGYVHAQDRLWQMEAMRRIAAGRLSEIFGEDFIETDKFFLTMGIDEAAKKTIAKIDKESQAYKLSLAYLKGINQFIDEGSTPIEFSLIGITKEHYTINDIYNVFGYMSFSFSMAQKTDPLLSNLKTKLAKSYLDELAISVDPNTSTIPIYNINNDDQNQFVSKINTIVDNLPIPPFIGSNAWVIGSQKTANGKVIFNNDPHIAYSQASVWYQSHIVCPDFELYGFNLALTPFSLLGHNRQFAYGLTMFENDDIDFYAEDVNENNKLKYLIGSEYKTFSTKHKSIKVKNSKDINFSYKTSIHGPIMNNFIGFDKSNKAIAMDWIYTKFDNQMLEATYEITHSNSLDKFKKGVSKIVAPGLNVMYGDTNGNIAWFAGAKLYSHINNVNTNFILDGSNDLDDKLTYIDFKDNPQSINPPWNYVYSANNQPDKILDSIYYPGYYLSEDRAKRITDVLNNLNGIKVGDMKHLITDVTSSKVPHFIQIILTNINIDELNETEKTAFHILESWKGNFDLNEIAPTIYTKFKYLFLKNVFKDEMEENSFNQFMGTHLVKHQYNKQLESDYSIWNDNINTELQEDKHYIINKSFKDAVKQLEMQFNTPIDTWTWNKVHTVTHIHPITNKAKFLSKYLNVGPFPISGTNEVLNNQLFTLNEEGLYKVTGGPSTRRIVDFNDVENNSYAILPTGQSGNPFSKHYKDQAQKFVVGKFYNMLLNKEIIQLSEDKLIFSPK